MSSSGRPVRAAVLGLGTVGASLVQALEGRSDLQVMGGAVRRLDKPRPQAAFPLTDVPEELALHSAAETVVELMGGIEPAFRCVKGALELGRPVVTANKEMLARRGAELFEAAGDIPLECEAAVGGAVPLVRTVRQCLAGSRILRIRGILNGTTNYILTQMEMEGLRYEPALAQAQALGYAEADPTSDVEGWDSLYKGIVLAGLVTGVWLKPEECEREGIAKVSSEDLFKAGALGNEVKLVVDVNLEGARPEVSVKPVSVPKSARLASLDGPMNGAVITVQGMPDLFLSGPGAGGAATAAAVLGDLIGAARWVRSQA